MQTGQHSHCATVISVSTQATVRGGAMHPICMRAYICGNSFLSVHWSDFFFFCHFICSYTRALLNYGFLLVKRCCLLTAVLENVCALVLIKTYLVDG